MSENKLTEKDYWEVEVEKGGKRRTTGGRASLKARLVDKYFGKIREGYVKYLMYDVHCRRHKRGDRRDRIGRS